MEIANYKIVKLKFRGALHIGTGKTDSYDHSDEIIHSDTIKSALYSAYRQVYPDRLEGDEDVSFFESFQVSSTFPFYREEFFLPRPISGLPVHLSDLDENAKSSLSKKLKKIQYAGTEIFENLAEGKQVTVSEKHFDKSKRLLFAKPQDENTKIFVRDIQQRVYIPDPEAEGVDSQPYYIERLFFAPEAGLYFFLDLKNNELLKQIKTCLKILGDNGLGTDKNVGNGQFDFEIEDLDLKIPDLPTHRMALSLFCPEVNAITEHFLMESAFATVKRGGFIVSAEKEKYRHFRKKSIYMFAEGSVFPIDIPGNGKIVNLKPETVEDLHPVWRDGTSFFLPVKLS